METISFPRFNRFPVLIQEEEKKKEKKTCYFLGKDGFLRQLQSGEKGWHPAATDLGQKLFKGFDALVDQQGNHLLAAFDGEGALFLLQPEREEGLPTAFYKDPHREIICLSACLDSQNTFHLLHLSSGKEKRDPSLIYHCYKHGQWGETVPLDAGAGSLGQIALVLSGPDDSLFVFYCLHENGVYRPILRRLKGEQGLEKPIIFPENWNYPLLPSICFTADHALHYSLINRHPSGISYLKYACLADDRWINSLTRKVSPFTLPLAPLCFRGKQLLLSWKNLDMLSCLYSDNAGKNWQWAGSSPLGQYPQIFRYRAVSEGQKLGEEWQTEYLFADGIPPRQLIKPGELPYREKETGPFEKKFQSLDQLYSSLAAHAGQIQNSNMTLQSKLTKREQDYYRLYTKSVSQVGEFQKAESAFKSTIKELQNLVNNEKKEQEERQKKQTNEVSRLKEEIKNLRMESAGRGEIIRELEEKNRLLEQEKEELQKRREYFWQKLFK